MKYSIILMTIIFSSSVYSEKVTRDYLLKNVIDMMQVNAHTCKRVQSMSKGVISDEQCKAKLVDVNKECMRLILKYVPSKPSGDETRGMVNILMTCPIAKIMGSNRYDPKKVMKLRPNS